MPQPHFIRGITICVEYTDLLKITLPRNMTHLSECYVVTSPNDTTTIEYASSIPGVYVVTTDAFYRYGASFNKGLAMEMGFNHMRREGWMLIWDADTLFPPEMPLDVHIGNLYSPHRVILQNPSHFNSKYQWQHRRVSHDREFCGYFQLFHADDPVLETHPWYDVSFAHAGGCDSYFQTLWERKNKIRPNFKVLHLGPRDRNWYGRTTIKSSKRSEDHRERIEKLEELHRTNGWGKYSRNQYQTRYDRIIVPGYPISEYRWHNSIPPSEAPPAS